MDGLECSEILLSHAKREESRFDSEYYSKENLLLQTIIDTAGNKTINEYGGVLDCSAFYPSITGYYSNAVFDYAATHQDSVFSTLADSVELLDYPEMTLSNWKIDHGKIILKGWFLAKLKLQNGTAEEIGTGAGVIEEISKGFDFEIMLDDDFSIVRDSENNDCILIQLQKS